MIALEWLHECCMGHVLGRKPEHETVCFPCKVAAAGDVRLGSFHARIVPPMCAAMIGCSCVRSSMRFLNLWLHDRIGMAA